MIVRELITRLGFTTDEAKLKRYEAQYKSLKKVAAGAAAAVTAIGAAGAFAVKGLINEASGLERLKAATQATISDLQRMRFLAEQNSVSFEEMGLALRFFARQTGIKPTIAALQQVARTLRTIPEGDRAQWLTKLFGRGGAILGTILEQGPERIAEMVAEFDKMNVALGDEDVAAASKAERAWLKLLTLWRGLRNQIALALLPALESLVGFLFSLTEAARNWRVHWERFTDVIRRYEHWLRAAAFAVGLLLAAMVLGRVLAFATAIWAVVRSVSALTALAAVVTGFTAAWAGLLAVLASTVVIAGAIAVVFALLMDDIFSWQEGQDSVIGMALGSWEEFLDGIELIVSDIKNLWGSMIDWLSMKLEGFVNDIRLAPGALADALPQWAQGLLGLSEIAAEFRGAQPGAPPAPLLADGTPPLLARPAAAAGGGQVRVQTEINVSVPPGTPEEQVTSFRQIIEETIQGKVVDPLNEAYPELEYGR